VFVQLQGEKDTADLEILKTDGIDKPEKFKQEAEEIIQDFAIACVQGKADELSG
jgi:hypothetical protein